MNPIPPTHEQTGPRASTLRPLWTRIRRRITSGLLVVLPVFITFWVLYWLYSLIRYYAIDPVTRLAVYAAQGRQPDGELTPLLEQLVAPLIAILALLVVLYALGSFVGLRLLQAFDRLLRRVPVVTAIHNIVRKAFQSFEGPTALSRFKRVVLVTFPHPGMRVPGFVTASCQDSKSNKTILCVYVPTTPIPTSGYMLLVPEVVPEPFHRPLPSTVPSEGSSEGFPRTSSKHGRRVAQPALCVPKEPPFQESWRRVHGVHRLGIGEWD